MRSAVVAALLLASGCAGRFDHPPRHPGAASGDTYDSIVLDHQSELHINAAGGYERIDRDSILILRPAGRQYGRVAFRLDYRTTLLAVRARSFGPDGAGEERLDPQNIAYSEVADIPGIAFPDQREVIFDVPGVSVGDVVEVEVHTAVRDLAFIEGFFFDGIVPTKKSRFTVDVAEGFELVWSHSAGDALSELPPKIDGRRYTWEKDELPAHEPSASPEAIRLSVVRVPAGVESTVFSSWDELARWYSKLATGLAHVSKEQWGDVEREVKEATARALFEHVRDHVRYVAYYREGIEGIRPHAASDVLRLRFGDCKDMATLLLALYSEAGISSAYPVLISTRDALPFDERLPTTGSFNHMIVALETEPGHYTFLDPTDKGNAFGEPGFALHGQTAVVVKPDHAELVSVPFMNPSQHSVSLKWNVHANGSAHLSASWSGVWAAVPSRLAGGALSDFARGWIEDRLLQRWPAAHVASATIAEDQRGVHLEADVIHPGYRVEQSGEVNLPLRWFFDDPRALALSSDASLLRDLPRRWEEELVLDSPPGADASPVLPESRALKGEWGEAKWSASADRGAVKIDRVLVVEAKRRADRKEVIEALDAIDRAAVLWPGKRGVR